MTQITVKQLAAAKRTAMNVLPLTNKKAKLQAKIAEMEAEIVSLNKQIDAQQGYVKSFAAGLTTEQLLIRNENKVFEANPNVIYFDEEKRVYVIIEKEAEVNDEEAPTGSDFDADKEVVDNGVLPSAEEIAAAEEARHEEEAQEEAEQRAAVGAALTHEEAVRAAKERITADKPSVKEREYDPFA